MSTNLATARIKCRLCRCALSEDEEDDVVAELCSSCKVRPEARRLGIRLADPVDVLSPATPSRPSAKGVRDFTPAEKSLIAKVHAFMPPQQLLTLLNERLFSDLGPDVDPYTPDQLHAAVAAAAGGAVQPTSSWAGLRKLINQARRSGVLAQVTAQVIDDFAIVYGLNAKQVLVLKDTLLLNNTEDAQ